MFKSNKWVALAVCLMSISWGASAATTAYQVIPTPPTNTPETGWITGVNLQALYWIDQTSAINSSADLNAILNPTLPNTVGTVDVSGTNPGGPVNGSFSLTGGASFGGFNNPFSKVNTTGNPTSGTITLGAGTSYLGLKDGNGGILLGIFANTLTASTSVNYLMTWTDLGNNPNQALSNYFYGANTEVFPPAAVPVPAAVWLFGSALIGLINVGRRKAISAA